MELLITKGPLPWWQYWRWNEHWESMTQYQMGQRGVCSCMYVAFEVNVYLGYKYFMKRSITAMEFQHILAFALLHNVYKISSLGEKNTMFNLIKKLDSQRNLKICSIPHKAQYGSFIWKCPFLVCIPRWEGGWCKNVLSSCFTWFLSNPNIC